MLRKKSVWKFTLLVGFMSILVTTWIACFTIAGAQETMTLSFWDWHAPRLPVWEEKLREYEVLNPKIRFKTMLTPSKEYWKKIPLAIASGSGGPDIFQFHNARTNIFLSQLEPYPSDLFPLEKMRNEYYEFDTGFVFNDQFYFFPAGLVTFVIYYNERLWEEGGLGKEDIPETWGDLRKVAKKLTQYDSTGAVDVSGLCFTQTLGGGIWQDFYYQLGGYIYSEDAKSVEWNTPLGIKAMDFIRDLVFKDRVLDPGFLEAKQALGAEKAAMTYFMTWASSWFSNYFPDLQYSVFQLPTPQKEKVWARGRNNWEVGCSVLKMVPDEKKEEAFKFLKWVYDGDDIHIKLNTVVTKAAPGKKSIWTCPEVTQDPIVNVVLEQVRYTVFPGEVVMPVGTAWSDLTARIMSGMNSEEALRITETEINEALKENPPLWVVERQYYPPTE